MHYLLFHWIWRVLSLYTCALKHPAGLEKQAADDGTRCSLAPEGGAVNTPWGLSPGGTWAWELSFAQPGIIPRCQEALALCDSARCFSFHPGLGTAESGCPVAPLAQGWIGSDLWNSWRLQKCSRGWTPLAKQHYHDEHDAIPNRKGFLRFSLSWAMLGEPSKASGFMRSKSTPSKQTWILLPFRARHYLWVNYIFPQRSQCKKNIHSLFDMIL